MNFLLILLYRTLSEFFKLLTSIKIVHFATALEASPEKRIWNNYYKIICTIYKET